MKACVVGAALGTLIAAYLARNGIEVGIVARANQASVIVSRGIEVNRVFANDSFHVDRINVIENFAGLREYDLVILAVKAFDMKGVVSKLYNEKLLDPARHVLCLIQNGLGIEDSVRFYFPKMPLIRLTTTNGALLEQPGVVKHTGLGDAFIGFWDDARPAYGDAMIVSLKDALVGAGLRVEISSNMVQKVWEKLIVNVGINAIGAIFRVPNGRILENTHLKTISDHLVTEATAIARKAKILPRFNGHAAVKKVLEQTAANRNSMLQDIERGRKCEIDFINGAISRQGIELRVATPWNDAVVEMIHGFESILRNLP